MAQPKPQHKYFCQKCAEPKLPFLAAFHVDSEGNKLDKPVYKEVITELPNKKEVKEGEKQKVFKGRKLECNHYISVENQSFLDYPSDNLSSDETQTIRVKIDKSLIEKTPAEVEETIIRWAEEYQTLLKVASKMSRQAKYALQLVDDLRIKYQGQLAPEEKKTFEQKFTAMFGEKPKPVVDRIKKEAKKKADSEKDAMDAIKALLNKKGYKGKDLFKKAKEGNLDK